MKKITGGELAREIGNSYNVTLNVGSIVSCQQLLDEYDMRGTNHVIISPETLSKMESDPALKKSVLSKIEEFCSSESQKEIQSFIAAGKKRWNDNISGRKHTLLAGGLSE